MIKLYKVIIGGRDCLSSENGRTLKEGDILAPSWLFMLKVSDGKNPTCITSMFNTEVFWEKEGFKYKELTPEEIKPLIPHLHKNKLFGHRDVKSEFIK